MLQDLGSRDDAFLEVIQEVQLGTLKLAGLSKEEYAVIPMQGSGTFGIEGVLSTVINKSSGVRFFPLASFGSSLITFLSLSIGLAHYF
jgi:2-aminoethylphosphonate-pyruvate transaminase